MLSHSLLTPLSAPGATAPCTLARVKSQLGISDTSQDAELRLRIRSCELAFAGPQGLGREYARRQWRARVPGIGGHFLPLPLWPIESVSLVAEGGPETFTTVDAADYEIVEPGRQMLYRIDGWGDSRTWALAMQASGADVTLEYKVELIGGWVMPDLVTDWSNGAAVAAGNYVRSTAPSLYLFQAAGAASLATPEPTWPTTLGGTVVHGGTTFTAVAARRWPDDLEDAALLTVKEWHEGGDEIPAGIQSEQHGSTLVAYDFVGNRQGRSPIPPAARAVLAAYR